MELSKRGFACVRIELPDEVCTQGVLEALRPETSRSITPRARVVVGREGASIVLRFYAKDTVALRASINSYLRWVSSLKECYEVVKRI